MPGEWLSYGSDKGNTKYSPLDQIDPGNVRDLQILWRRPGVDPQHMEAFPDLNPSNDFRSTPLMVGGVLYASNAVGLVEAFDPGTGRTLWIQEPLEEGPRGVDGRSTRGLAYWRNGSSRRIFAVRGEFLVALSAETGVLVRDFGDGGKVNLNRNVPRANRFRWSSGPIVAGDVVIIGGGGGGGGDFPMVKEGAPEDIRAYDLQSGRLRWTFHVVPQPG